MESQFVVKKDGMRLVGSPEEVAVEGGCLPRKQSVEEGYMPSVRKESVDCILLNYIEYLNIICVI